MGGCCRVSLMGAQVSCGMEVMLDGDNTRKRGGSRESMATSSPTCRDDGEPVEGKVGRMRRPLISILAIDPIQALLHKEMERGDLHRLHGRAACIRTSLYVDDVVCYFLRQLKRIVTPFPTSFKFLVKSPGLL